MLQMLKQGAIGALTEVVAGTPLRRVFLKSEQSRVVIFTLHRAADPDNGICGHDERTLRQTVRRIRRLGVPIVGLSEVLDAERGVRPLPPVSVCFTLDDGYHDQGDVTLPLLLEHEARPTLFVITGFLDGHLWPWDAQVQEYFRLAPRSVVEVQTREGRLSLDLQTSVSRNASRRCYTALCKSVSDARREELVAALAKAVGAPTDLPVPAHHRPMTWDRARELEGQGARFGSHSVSHRLFSKLSEAAAAEELQASRDRIEAELREPLPILAWPIGRTCDFGQRDVALATWAGYKASADVSTVDHHVPDVGDPGVFPILHRHGFPDRPRDAARMVLGLHRAFDRWRRADPQIVPASPDLARVRRLVFVCKGNICRSPYAEARARQLGVDAISCGISAAPGASADPEAQRNAGLREIDLGGHRSSRLDEIDLTPADLLVTMDGSHHRAAAGFAARSGAQWTDAASWLRLHNGVVSIADPYGRSDLEFQTAFDLIDDAVDSLIAARSMSMRSS